MHVACCDDSGNVQTSSGIESPPSVVSAFVGCVVPDEPQFRTVAFSRAGQMFQQELLGGLRDAGINVCDIFSIIAIPSYPHPNVRRIWVRGGKVLLANGLPITLIPFLNITPVKQFWIGLATLFRLALWGWQHRKAKYRLVLSYNLTVPPGLFTLMGARLARAKAVVLLCDINVPGERVPARWPWRLDYWLQKKLIPHFDGHSVASDAIARTFLPGRAYVRIEGGIANELFAGGLEEKSSAGKTPSAPFIITSAGGLNESNGVLVLLKAFSLLKGDQWRLRIAGAGPLEQHVREASRNDPRIEYLGLIPFLAVLQLYSTSDVLINMRVTKALNTEFFFPSKMMEYLASGVPVISTCTGHVREEFGRFCYLLEEETPEALAGLILTVSRIDVQERKNLGRSARTYVATHKTWQAQSQRLARYICETVLGIRFGPTGSRVKDWMGPMGSEVEGEKSRLPVERQSAK